jgi:hypothetical protein
MPHAWAADPCSPCRCLGLVVAQRVEAAVGRVAIASKRSPCYPARTRAVQSPGGTTICLRALDQIGSTLDDGAPAPGKLVIQAQSMSASTHEQALFQIRIWRHKCFAAV